MAAQSENKTPEPGLLKTVSSIQFGLVVLVTIVCVAVIGTIIPQGRPPEFYQEHYSGFVNYFIYVFRFDDTYRSPLFLGLMGLFGLNLTLCSLMRFPSVVRRAFKPALKPDVETIKRKPVAVSVSELSLEKVGEVFHDAGFTLRRLDDNRLYGEKGRLGYLGASIVHLSLLILLSGGMISLITGLRGHITLLEGETANEAVVTGGRFFPLGFEIELESFNVEFYEDFPDRPKSYNSQVTVTFPDGSVLNKDIRVNDPLMLNNMTIYQSSYGVSDEPMNVSASDDTARVAVLLKGMPETVPPIVTLEMRMGEEYTIPGFGDSITVRLDELHSNFRRGAQSPGEINPAVKIAVMVNGTERWSVYSFKNFPGLNMPMFDDILFIFTMLDIRTGISETGRDKRERYYTVLGFMRDRGIPFMWVGAVCMMIGLFLSFYIRPRRIWVIEEDDRIHIGAQVKGDFESFRNFIESTLKRAN